MKIKGLGASFKGHAQRSGCSLIDTGRDHGCPMDENLEHRAIQKEMKAHRIRWIARDRCNPVINPQFAVTGLVRKANGSEARAGFRHKVQCKLAVRLVMKLNFQLRCQIANTQPVQVVTFEIGELEMSSA